MDALEKLKVTALNQDIWRDEGGIINKGPFPPPNTAVKIQRLSRDNITGEATLKISPVYGDVVYYETGDSDPKTMGAVYNSPFKVPESSPFGLAIARRSNISSELEKININDYKDKVVKVNPGIKTVWKHRHENLTARNWCCWHGQ